MARGRPSRAAARRSTPATPLHFDDDDENEEMVDAPEAESRAETPAEDDDAGTPAQESEEEEKAASERSATPVVTLPRKKRLGRPPKNRPPDWNVIADDGSQSGTPVKRKRGRPAGGGFRGRPRGGPVQATRVAIDKEGTMMDVVNDEVDLPEDPAGEKKVDKLGNLQDGRDYRVRVFTITGRGDRLYMLSTEPARCCGFRDSYLFFTKHMQLHKIIIDDAEKRDLIERDIIPHSYKGRAIGVVTARSVFREFGARIIIGGKKIIDDYNETAARERGDIEGELAEPHDKLPPPGEPYNKNQYVAWHGASSVYHTGAPSVPLASGKPVPGKRKVNITSANWQFEHARSASRFNSSLSAIRKANLQGIYDPHTNLMCYPRTTQPTHAKWEEVSPAESDVPPLVRKHYLVVDTYVQKPPYASLGLPGPDADYLDVGINGLPDLEDEDVQSMTPEARETYVQAKKDEKWWRDQFHSESVDGARPKLKIGFTGVPV
ncbi:chromatin structure-remodeling complex subunit RSC7 [Kalmusia sp. IMI 367209]|nr:chromatin structure-remodeling complex subunit RSC7 [Kalmusia sp. IMI 367209]